MNAPSANSGCGTDRPAYFEPVRQGASDLCDLLDREPRVAGPWCQLFNQVQNPRHVLSELLQNADDAGATEAEASLDNGCFVFRHNGEDFTEEHFTSLCNFGYSNKRTLHTIGFRGIGFKSTFSLGDEVRLTTPTLSVAFRRRRFTEPVWVERPDTHGAWTEVRVAVQDESRQQALRKNLNEWLTSPVSLLFFRSIRSLRIGEEAVEWVRAGAGPAVGSEWVALSSHPDKRYLVVRSNEEDFPPESVAEIRAERMVTQDEKQPLPPCRVELVLGVVGHLFVILQAGVKTALPFACNAPFIQDPARVAIKDPSTSPTNRWLLRRVGELAVQAMLGWLRREDLSSEVRCQAYDIMPAPGHDVDSLEDSCAGAVTEAFLNVIRSERVLLSESVQLEHVEKCWALPTVVLGIWAPAEVQAIFCGHLVSVLCRYVSAANRRKLGSWDFTIDFDRGCVLDPLDRQCQWTETIPRPSSMHQLMALWQYVGQDLTPGFLCPESLKKLRIVPIEGRDTLCAAPDAVRFDARERLARPEDWNLLARFLAIVDGEWVGFLREQQLQAEDQKDPALRKKVGLACALLDALGLGRDTDASTIIQRATAGFFALPHTPMDDGVRLAHIAASLGAALPPGFRFFTRDMNSRPVTEAIVVDQEGRLEDLLPKDWYGQHVLHDAYCSGFASCTREQWEQWVASKRSGLLGFVPIALSSEGVMDESRIRSLCRGRGWELPFTYSPQYKRSYYCLKDWDFGYSHWQHWEACATADNQFWGRLVSEFLRQPAWHWQGKAEASLEECARNGKSRPIDLNTPFSKRSLRAAWLAKFRELPCLKDTHGAYRRPAELLRRTRETEPLLDIEPFVAAEYDIEALWPLLDLLGVRADPPGPDSLLSRLKALAKAPVPPLEELGKLYRRLDQMLGGSGTSWHVRAKMDFSSEKLIWSQCGAWTRASEVFLSADEDDVPGAPVVHASVGALAMWTKVGVAERPTAELAIQWLKTLPSAGALPESELRRVQRLVARHPERIWPECGHWLNLAGAWIPVCDLKYSLTRHAAMEWKHLFPQVLKETADLRKLTPDACERPPFSHLTALSSVIEERTQGSPTSLPEPERKEWMQALGRTLRRVVLDDAEATARIRALAARLEGTSWQPASGLEVVPYIDGTPAGTPRSVEVLWSGAVLYVPDQPASKLIRPVVHELSRPFHCEDIKEAMAYCVNRPAGDVVDYLEAYMALAPAEPGTVQPPETTNLGGAGTDTPPDADGGGADTKTGPTTEPQKSQDVAANEGGGGLTTDDTVKVVVRPPKPPPPHQPDLMARFAAARGYIPAAPGLLCPADGSSLARTQDGVFPWEHRSRAGNVLQYYWPKATCPEDGPLELGAVKWDLLDKHPDLYTLILQDAAGAPMELTGRQVKEKRDRGLVEVHAAAYRIVFRPERKPE